MYGKVLKLARMDGLLLITNVVRYSSKRENSASFERKTKLGYKARIVES